MRTAIIKKRHITPYEVVVHVDGVNVAAIRCNDYEVEQTMIVCKHGKCGYNSYVHVDDYTCETWK